MLTLPLDLRTGTPLWLHTPTARVPFTAPKRDRKTDICIIGAGVTGAMLAEELTSAGLRVIILDRRAPLIGSTAATTALLQSDIDRPLSLLGKQIGQERAMRAWRRSKLTLEGLAAKIEMLELRCALKRTDALYLAGDLLDHEGLHDEWRARQHASLTNQFLSRAELREGYGIDRAAAIRAFDNLTVNPLKMAAGFHHHALARGAEILAPATAAAVTHGKNDITIHLAEGPDIQAKALVYCTGYELPRCLARFKREIMSTYAIATRPQPQRIWPTGCMIWESSDPYLYMRATSDGRVICGGEDEEFATPEKRDALMTKKKALLEKKLAKIFPQLDTRAEFSWSAAFGSSSTGLPHIGRVPNEPHTYAILAYGGNGITFSRLGAEIIRAELLDGKKDPDADLFAF